MAPAMISRIKRNNCGKALEIARLARGRYGGNGIADGFSVLRRMLNLATASTYEAREPSGRFDIFSKIRHTRSL